MAAPPNPTHQSGSSACTSANAPSATDAKAEKASASGAGTRPSDGPAAQAQTCTAARASPSRLSPNERERGRSLKPQTAIAVEATSPSATRTAGPSRPCAIRSEEHTSELQSRLHLVCRLLLEKKKNISVNVLMPT